MSGIAKAVKKVWRPIERLNSKVVNVATLGLHNKTKKIRHKIIKSKVFKVVVAAAAIYFGGAALLSMAGGGTAAAGVGSAWSGVTGAGSALMSGNFAAAGSSLSAGFTSGAAAGATGTFAGGMAAQGAALSATTATASAGASGGLLTGGATGSGIPASTPQLAAMHPTTTSAAMTPVATETAASGGGLLTGAWNSLGDAGKAALISSGVNMGGQMIQGYSAQKAAEDAEDNERRRRTYWGVNGEGLGDTSGRQLGGLLQLAQATPYKSGITPTTWNNPTPQVQPGVQGQQQSFQPKTLDELIKFQERMTMTG